MQVCFFWPFYMQWIDFKSNLELKDKSWNPWNDDPTISNSKLFIFMSVIFESLSSSSKSNFLFWF